MTGGPNPNSRRPTEEYKAAWQTIRLLIEEKHSTPFCHLRTGGKNSARYMQRSFLAASESAFDGVIDDLKQALSLQTLEHKEALMNREGFSEAFETAVAALKAAHPGFRGVSAAAIATAKTKRMNRSRKLEEGGPTGHSM